MEFTSWSPTHTVLVVFAIVAFIGQVAVYFYRTGQNDKKIEKLGEKIEKLGETFVHAQNRLEDRIDKRFTETNQRISDMQADTNHKLSDMNQRLSDMQADTNHKLSDMNQRLSDMQAETNQRFTETNQRLSDMQADTNQRFTEVNHRLSDIEASIRQLNQNHIDHLAHHERKS